MNKIDPKKLTNGGRMNYCHENGRCQGQLEDLRGSVGEFPRGHAYFRYPEQE